MNVVMRGPRLGRDPSCSAQLGIESVAQPIAD